ncbi:MAG: hypothetical protein JXB07_15630, partial [Anaerolineae bacterium]|nr:hypothetical protein [Anaerolineae bacterium]
MNTRTMTPITVITICLILASCASPGAATPTTTQLPQPPITEAAAIAPTGALGSTATLAPTSTLPLTSEAEQPTRTPRPIPTDTPVPTATAYPAPAVPLSPTGPWLIFRAGDYASGYYLWAINPDGTGLTRLTDERICTFAIQPNRTVQSGLV